MPMRGHGAAGVRAALDTMGLLDVGALFGALRQMDQPGAVEGHHRLF